MKNNKKRITIFLTLIIIIAVMVIGYAALQTTLNITGNTSIKGNSWDVHWANVQISPGSTTDVITPATITNPTQVEFNINLNKPGDYYEFTVDAVNSGTVDAMVEVLSKKVLNSSNVEITLPNYLIYEVTYIDNIPIEANQLLKANTQETIKVRVEYKMDISEDDLQTTNTSIKFRVGLSYKQSSPDNVNSFRSYAYSNSGTALFKMDISELEYVENIEEEMLIGSETSFFIKHTLYNNKIYDMELGFYHNNNIYYLSTFDKSEYEEKKQYLNNIFGNDHCASYVYSYDCSNGTITVSVFIDGSVRVTSENNSYICEIEKIEAGLYSKCEMNSPSA